jgi:branched-chain amino acid transport system ATP-binding protein
LAAPTSIKSSAPLLAIEQVASGYGRTEILHGISAEVIAGEIVAVIGPNGAGKTTLLNTISGLSDLRRGAIRLKGEDIAGLRPDKVVARGISHCPEGRRIFQRLTVEENLIAAYVAGRPRSYDAMLHEVFRLFPVLGERRKSPANRFSGGQQQMLAVARALMAQPELLLLDEPSLGLAPKLVSQILEIVLNLAGTGMSIVLVEQNVDAALEISDYAYVIENGRCVLEGPSEKLLADDRLREAYLPSL